MRTIDYMNDPRMADLAGEPLPVREVHAWRLAIQDKKQKMTPEQKEAHYRAVRERTDALCARHGFTLRYAKPAVMA
jgi:uncharacterized membrane protein